jgi:hypothetical protein
MFALFSGVELGNGTVVSHDARPHFAALAFVILEGGGTGSGFEFGYSSRDDEGHDGRSFCGG